MARHGWLVVFPLGCGLAVLSFTVRQTLSGRHLGTTFQPVVFLIALLLFGGTAWTTLRHLRARERPTGGRP